jgi:hypothetical protein
MPAAWRDDASGVERVVPEVRVAQVRARVLIKKQKGLAKHRLNLRCCAQAFSQS